MLDSVIGCITPFVWAAALIFLILNFFALFFVQAVYTHLSSEHFLVQDNNGQRREDYLKAFGGISTAMATLFMAVSGGQDWGENYALLKEIGPAQSYTYIMYIMFFNVAVWNIVTGIFMEQALRLAAPNENLLKYEKQRLDMEAGQNLVELCQKLNGSDDSTLTMQEFCTFMENPEFRSYFESRHIDIADAEHFFVELAQVAEAEEVPITTFAEGCMRLKGVVSTVDLQKVHFEAKLMHMTQKHFHNYCSMQFKHIQQILQDLSGELYDDCQMSRELSYVEPGPRDQITSTMIESA